MKITGTNLKQIGRYLAYGVMLFGFLIIASHYLIELKKWVSMTYRPYPYQITFTLVYVVTGVLLGLEHIYTELGKSGQWRVKVEKLVVLGIPAAFFCLNYFLYFTPYPKPEMLNLLLAHVAQWGQSFIAIMGVFLGYLSTTSFYKK